MTSRYENKKMREGFTNIIGCDEVGRGCLAGPVVAAAVILKDVKHKQWFREVRDSKQLLPKKREDLSEIIKANALWGIGVVEEKVIDEINIHNASLLAMRKAVESLILSSQSKYFLYLDGKFSIPSFAKATEGESDFQMEQEAVVEGDGKILSVAAASIVAKVFRDELMKKYHNQYPHYNFAQHKGYATFHHRQMVKRYGLSAIHRLSFCGNLIS